MPRLSGVRLFVCLWQWWHSRSGPSLRPAESDASGWRWVEGGCPSLPTYLLPLPPSFHSPDWKRNREGEELWRGDLDLRCLHRWGVCLLCVCVGGCSLPLGGGTFPPELQVFPSCRPPRQHRINHVSATVLTKCSGSLRTFFFCQMCFPLTRGAVRQARRKRGQFPRPTEGRDEWLST